MEPIITQVVDYYCQILAKLSTIPYIDQVFQGNAAAGDIGYLRTILTDVETLLTESSVAFGLGLSYRDLRDAIANLRDEAGLAILYLDGLLSEETLQDFKSRFDDYVYQIRLVQLHSS